MLLLLFGASTTMDPNYIAIEFLCPICNTLPIGAVLAEDGVSDAFCLQEYVLRLMYQHLTLYFLLVLLRQRMHRKVY